MADLGTLGGDSLARAVNEKGQIVGSSYNPSGQERAVLWLPGDTAPPDLTVSVTPDVLWPANHKYVTVQATVAATDDTDPNPEITLFSVTSNEPDDGEGDGNTVNDVVIVDQDTFQLRAERNEYGTGRIYTITYWATDASGKSATAWATVAVPITH